MIAVLVWSKSAVTRAGLESIVQDDPRLQLTGAGARPPDLRSAVRQLSPDVVLLDGADTSITGMLSDITADPAGPPIALLVGSPQRATILRALQCGVRALVLCDAPPSEITAAVIAAYEELTVFSSETLAAVFPGIQELPLDGELPPGEPLSERENAVLSLMAEGAGNREIASRLGISENTVKFHVSSILNKLGAATRTEAVTRGYKEGLIFI